MHCAAKWSIFTELVVIQHDIFCSFFLIRLPTLLPVSEWAKTIATRDSWSSSLQKTSIKNKARFWVLVIFSWVWCVFAEWRCDCAVSHESCRCATFQAHTKTPTVYQDCTSQDHRNHTYSINDAQPCRLCVFLFFCCLEENLHIPTRGPTAGLYRQTGTCCEEDPPVSQTQQRGTVH